MMRQSTPSNALLPDAVADKARLYRGLADASRLRVLEALRGGVRSVGEVVAQTGLSQPNVSNHLACLLDCGLVTREQRGRFAFYSLSDHRVEALLALADELLSDTAAGVLTCPRCESRDAAHSSSCSRTGG